MNKQQQWAYNEGYQTALRSLAAKEETTDYRLQQMNMMIKDVAEKLIL